MTIYHFVILFFVIQVLNIDYAALRDATSGRIISIFSTDLEKIVFLYPYYANFFISIAQFVTMAIIIWVFHGLMASFACMTSIIIILSLQTFLAVKQGSLRSNIAEKSDHRILLMNEILSGMQTVKMQVWEKFFKNKIGYYRQAEILESLSSFLYKISYRIFSTIGIKIPLIVIILICKWSSPETLTSAKILRLISFLSTIEADFFFYFADAVFLTKELHQSFIRVEVTIIYSIYKFLKTTSITPYLYKFITFVVNSHF